ncbi:MAG TPA: hypothetical protein VLJ61_09035 [Pyrinomonadaceae bacterium]|nr:hypothetical protein [Pyrinomonadaceae bacterium]
MSEYDEFIEHLEAALEDEDGREVFMIYLQGLTKERRTELLDEVTRREAEAEVC